MTPPQVRASEASCSYGCLDPECDACVSPRQPHTRGSPASDSASCVGRELRAIGTLATVAGLWERLSRELLRAAEGLRP